ncbi:glycosyltransferase family 4 protein [Pseudodesulfovibrio karagichevae]|uniref:Glycosyltransferase family 4 protein n=1 Tax=Pseudodesulfovibrio karagichevae TaxID=3239305 RepID=A0ABV4K1X6_9BACT
MPGILVNALPLMVVGTGVGRYLRGLYGALEAELDEGWSIGYFTGRSVDSGLPGCPAPGWRERVGQLLWRMPTPIALRARLVRNGLQERRFARLCGDWTVYHEAGYFPMPCGRREARIVFTMHDLSLLLHPEWHPAERVAFWKRHFAERVGWADAFCAVSEFTKRQMTEHLALSPDRITVTPLGVDEAAFNRRDDLEAQALLDKAGVSGGYLLFVGSGDPRKRLNHAVEVLELLGWPLPLVVVGWSGWDHARARGVVDIGYVSDRVLAQLYRRARLLLMPSEYEGFGLPVLEAMACGCPVLSSGAEALREVGGDATARVDTLDPRSFAEAVDALVGDDRRLADMAAKGVARAKQFSWQETARKTLRAFRG